MSSTSEQFSAATQAQLENQLAVIQSLSATAFGGIEKLIALQLHTAKQSLENSTASAQQLLSAKDAKELFELSTAQAQPRWERLVSYGRELADIAAETRAEILGAVSNGTTPFVPFTAIHIDIRTPVAHPIKDITEVKETKKAAPVTTKQLPLIVEAHEDTPKAAPAKKAEPKKVAPKAIAKAAPKTTPKVTPKVTSKTVAKPVAAPVVPATPVVTPVTAEATPAVKEVTPVAEEKPVAVAAAASRKPLTKSAFPASPKIQAPKVVAPIAKAKVTSKAKSSK